MDTLRVTLSRHFGSLTQGWVGSLSDARLTPGALTTPSLRRWHVRSLTTHRELSLPKRVIRALPYQLPRWRPAFEQSRKEPAISGLDWTFTPIRRSSEGFVHHQPFGPPPHFREASTYPRIDRPASGDAPRTPGEHTSPLAPEGAAGMLLSLWLPG